MGATQAKEKLTDTAVASAACVEFFRSGLIEAALDGIDVDVRSGTAFAVTVRATIAGRRVVVHGPERATPDDADCAALAFAWRGMDPEAPSRPDRESLALRVVPPAQMSAKKYNTVAIAVSTSLAYLLYHASAGVMGYPFV